MGVGSSLPAPSFPLRREILAQGGSLLVSVGGGGGDNQYNPQYANYWVPLTRKRHILPHSAQPRHTKTGLRERGNDTSGSSGRSG